MLTARGDPHDRVAGLESGADDYLPKPFHFEELVARVRVRLRDDGPVAEETQLRVGGVALDLRTRWASVDGETVELSAREFELLRTFLEHPNQVLSREQLLARVWGYDYDPGSNVVDVYVGYLRRKLGGDGSRPCAASATASAPEACLAPSAPDGTAHARTRKQKKMSAGSPRTR